VKLSTGKLFWKFFIFFFVAQLISVLIVSALVWTHNQEEEKSRQIENSPPARTLVQAMSSILRYGGAIGATETLQEWLKNHPNHKVFVADQQQKELLGRKITNEVWQEVLKDQNTSPAVKKVTLENGETYFVFVPEQRQFRPEMVGQMEMMNLNQSHPPPNANEGPDGPPGPPGMHGPPPNRELFPLVPLLIGVLSSLISASILAWNFSKPIKTLDNAFGEVAKGNLDTSVSNSMGNRHDELSDLGLRFDQMVRQLKALVESQTRLLHHVSHEMRTPLTRLQIAIDLFKQNPDKLQSSLDRMELEVTRMDKLMGDVLDFSRLDAGIKKIRKEPIAIGEIMDEIVADAVYEAEIRQIKIHYSGEGNAEINASAELLHRAIENVVRNAIKYSPENSEISIEVKPMQENKLEIAVTDQGPGVPETEIDKIFEPFYRASVTSKANGYGLGLTLTKQIIEVHEGKISAMNATGRGLRVVITLPLHT
jgi:two-component system, OmpR family, sensor kinase